MEEEEEFVLERFKVSDEYKEFSCDKNQFDIEEGMWDISIIAGLNGNTGPETQNTFLDFHNSNLLKN